MTNLHMNPVTLTEFASAVEHQVHELAPHVRRARIARGVFGDFDAAHELTERLDGQLGAVHDRLLTSVHILRTVSHAARMAAVLTTQTDEVAAQSMQHIHSLIGSAERQLDQAVYGPVA